MAAKEENEKDTAQKASENSAQDANENKTDNAATFDDNSTKQVDPNTTSENKEPKDSSKQESVASFSLLDADTPDEKSSADKTEKKESKSEKKPESEQPKTDDDSKISSKSESILEKEQSKNISSEEVKDWLKDVRPDTTKEQEKGGGRPVFKWLAVVMILLLIAGAVAGGVYYYRQNVPAVDDPQVEEQEKQEGQEEQGESEEITDEPTPTPEDVDLSIYSVNVLNGSGVAGEAGSVADMLSEAGFGNPNANNADNQNYTETIIQHKETVQQNAIDEIVSALEEDYSVEVSDELLEEEEEYDIVVIVGERS